MVMEPIKRGLEQKKTQALLAGAAGSVSLLEQAANNLIAGPAIGPTGPAPNAGHGTEVIIVPARGIWKVLKKPQICWQGMYSAHKLFSA